MIHFVGAGPGAPDLITQRGAALLQRAGCVIYAGSLVNPALLGLAPEGCRIYNSAEMSLPEVLQAMQQAEGDGLETVRLHTGDQSIYGAVREQMDALDSIGIEWDDTPGVSSFCGAAAALGAEYMLPGISQTVIITRLAGRTPVPEREALQKLAAHGASMAIFLSSGMLPGVQQALVYKATWPEEKIVHCRLGELAQAGSRAGISRTALVLAGNFLAGTGYEKSCLYSPSFTTGYRQASQEA